LEIEYKKFNVLGEFKKQTIKEAHTFPMFAMKVALAELWN
jgi:hypothetical protein